MPLLPNGAALVVPVRSDIRYAPSARQPVPLRRSLQTPTAPERVAAVCT
jgi:hypothetical protein